MLAFRNYTGNYDYGHIMLMFLTLDKAIWPLVWFGDFISSRWNHDLWVKAQDQDGWSREPTGGSWGGGHDQPQVSFVVIGGGVVWGYRG